MMTMNSLHTPPYRLRRSLQHLKKITVLACVCFIVLFSFLGQANADWPHMATSSDGTPITYETFGNGQQTLIFVHGWSCDSRYWNAQVPYFASRYRVVVLDLAGHGNSGMSREEYSMKAFGEDVKAVAEATNSTNIILIGHSMGGPVIAEAARLMPDSVLGLIGVDTFINIERPMNDEQLDQILSPLRADFKAGSTKFIQSIIIPSTAPELRDWIIADMSSAPSNIAISALEDMLLQSHTGEAAAIFDEIKVPVHAINADKWPVNYEANRKHMTSFNATIIKGADHFLMMARPDEFNLALENVLATFPTSIQ